jgi:hypothetical protein
MKLALCTLAVCLALLASLITTQELIRAEGKRVRAALPRALDETAAGQESVAQKLDALNAQLAGLSRRLGELESNAGKRAPAQEVSPATTEARSLSNAARVLAASEERLAVLPQQIAELTAFVDRSFEHLEGQVGARAAGSDELKASLAALATKVDALDRYFKLLYTFLGLTFNRDNEDALGAYPSLDARVNDLSLSVEALRVAVEDVRKRVTPVVIEPTKHPR